MAAQLGRLLYKGDCTIIEYLDIAFLQVVDISTISH